MRIESYVLQVAIPDDLKDEITSRNVLKTIRKRVEQDELLNCLSFDLAPADKIMWIHDEQIKGNIPQQMLMSLLRDCDDENTDAEEKKPIGFHRNPEVAACK